MVAILEVFGKAKFLESGGCAAPLFEFYKGFRGGFMVWVVLLESVILRIFDHETQVRWYLD